MKKVGLFGRPLAIDPYWNQLFQEDSINDKKISLRDACLITFFIQCVYDERQPIEGYTIKYYSSDENPFPFVGINYDLIASAFPIFNLNQKQTIYDDIDRLIKDEFLQEPLDRPQDKRKYIQVHPKHLLKMKATRKLLNWKIGLEIANKDSFDTYNV